ncbi:hypothetical protein GCM10027187_40220 [Streptosporangium sandarakinum]|uniref:Uncharacterized protein n=1 Tax=Streptosporangium sandarakinum TaxID=1260955 RepID=A0A852V495_9ACTN|nr:hypothetical protein [Streptosporangium sandarakinum]NYF44647.1 hypothetical protein [Streptosporangium sandarakinum]
MRNQLQLVPMDADRLTLLRFLDGHPQWRPVRSGLHNLYDTYEMATRHGRPHVLLIPAAELARHTSVDELCAEAAADINALALNLDPDINREALRRLVALAIRAHGDPELADVYALATGTATETGPAAHGHTA